MPKPLRRLPMTVQIYRSGVRRRLRYRVKWDNGHNTVNPGQSYSRRIDLMAPMLSFSNTEEGLHPKHGAVLVRPNGDYMVLEEKYR